MALQIRPSTYRGQTGFALTGHDPDGRRVKIFTTTRQAAEGIREKVKAREELCVEDFRARE